MDNLLERFRAVDARIHQSVIDSSLARDKRDNTRSARQYERWNDKMFKAQDEHTAAWADRHALEAEWQAYYQKTYGAK